LDQPAPLAVQQLIAIMEEQTTWKWGDMFKVEKMNSNSIASGIAASTYSPPTGKDVGRSEGRCYPSVKVGLKRAALVTSFGDDIPAKGAGSWLLSQNFVEVTSTVPDARWAAPGDIVVYRYDDETEAGNLERHKSALERFDAAKRAYPGELEKWEKAHAEWVAAKKNSILSAASSDAAKGGAKASKKPKLKEPARPREPMRPDDENYGHIDVRTYDGYISDFKTRRLPRTLKDGTRKGFVVIGIYRKAFDPLPDIRLRAFLKVIREWENHGIADDAKRYFALQWKPGDKTQPFFTDTSTHPFSATPDQKGSFSGAYQIAYKTWRELIDVLGMPAGFSPALQDRYAVAKIEGRQALGLIREGKIKEAISTTSLTSEWSSLPGGVHARKGKTMEDLLATHRAFMEEIFRAQSK
jgi:muramidase (phage lysozyme)